MKIPSKLKVMAFFLSVIAIVTVTRIAAIYDGSGPLRLSFGEKATIFLWSDLLMPAITVVGGEAFPDGRVKEVSYGEHEDEKMDIVVSAKPSDKKVAIVHIHGGAWISGSKGRFYSKPLLKFSEAGYPVFSLNYPLGPNRQHPFLLRSVALLHDSCRGGSLP